MATLLDRLPFFDRPTLAEWQGRKFRIQSRQIVLWGSLSPFGQRPAVHSPAIFPAVLDTGFNDSFLIHESHLRDVAKVDLATLSKMSGPLVAGGRRFPLYAANMWVHHNRRGERDQFIGTPFLLELHRGIAVCTDADIHPRLPIVGMRALRQHELQLHIDYRKSCVSLTTSRPWWSIW